MRGLEGHHPVPASKQPLIAPLPCRGKVSTLLRGRISRLEEPKPSRDNAEPGQPRKGWQKRATKQVEVRHLRHIRAPSVD